MYPIKPFTRIRAALLFTPSILFIMLGLIFVLPNATLAQESNGVDKIEAISKRLEELQRQIETLKRENDELKKKFEERDTSKQALAAEKEKPTAEVRETPIAQQEVEPQKKEKRIEFGGQIRLRPELRYNDLNS